MRTKSQTRPLIIGLTGSIGMGKSTVAAQFVKMGVPLFNADDAVHALLSKDKEVIEKVAALFPGTVKKNAVDRKALGAAVFEKPSQLKKLENILHPRVQDMEKDAIEAAHKAGKKAIILEIPLLYETGANKRCDLVFCVSAPSKIQHERILKRKGMTRKRMVDILSHQMPDAIKRKRADFVIDTGVSLALTKKLVQKLWTMIEEELGACAK